MNLNLVIDTSHFRPFDYYKLASDAINNYNIGYEKQLAVYDKIALTLGDLASAVEGSTKAKQIYDSYQDQFNTTAEDFARGMNIRNAKQLSDLRRLYGTLIMQLEKASEARAKEAERRRQLMTTDRTMMYQDLGNLDKWMENPNYMPSGYSGNQLTNEVGALAKAASNDIINMEDDGNLNPYLYKIKKTRGFSASDVNTAIAQVLAGGIDSITDPIMRLVLLSAMKSSGIYDWADEATKRNAEIIAARGLYLGVGQSDITTHEDPVAKAQLDYFYKKKAADDEYARKNNAAKEHYRLNPLPLRNPEEISKTNQQLTSFDAYHTTEFDKLLDPTYGKAFMQQIHSGYYTGKGDEEVTVLSNFNRQKGWDDNRETVKLSDLDGYVVTNIRPSKYGITAIIQKDGDIKRIRVPKHVNPNVYNNIMGQVREIALWLEVKQSGYKPMIVLKRDANGRTIKSVELDKNGSIKLTKEKLSELDKLELDNKILGATDMMSMFTSQLLVPTKTKNEEFEPINY